MTRQRLLLRSMMLVLVLQMDRLMAEPVDPAPPAAMPAETAPPPADPVLSPRCRISPTAFGCANAGNLAAMARPADLVAGRPLAPAPGALEAAAIQRLYADKVKDLRREGTGAGGAGAPGGGQ